MTDRTSSYVADTRYPFGGSPELNPLGARLAFLDTGLAFPKTEATCELSFGHD